MPDVPTFRDYFTLARNEILVRNAAISAEIVQRDGTDANILVAAAAATADEVSGQVAELTAASFLDSAEGQALDTYVFDRYGLIRKAAAPAVGSVQFTSATPAPGAFSIPAGTRLRSQDGIEFVTTVSATYPALSVGPVTVAVRSSLGGISQQAKANTITSIVDAIAGSVSDLAVNNPLATAGASDAETDESLRDRARRFFTSARRGTLGAILAAALGVLGVTSASIFEDIEGNGSVARSTQLFVADSYTDRLASLTPTPPTYATQSQVLAATVEAALEDVRAAGIRVFVRVAVVSLLPVQLSLGFMTGFDPDTVALEARAAIVGYTNALPPGATWSPVDAINKLRAVPGLLITGGEIVSPVGPVTPRTLEVIRSTLPLVTALSLQPDRPIQNSTNPDVLGP
jgi:hypothetical protein